MIRHDYLGTWVSVPCLVGNYVYEVNKTHKKITTKKVSYIEIHIGRDNQQRIYIDFEIAGGCYDSAFGKTVFLNPGDAKRALDEYLSRKKT